MKEKKRKEMLKAGEEREGSQKKERGDRMDDWAKGEKKREEQRKKDEKAFKEDKQKRKDLFKRTK